MEKRTCLHVALKLMKARTNYMNYESNKRNVIVGITNSMIKDDRIAIKFMEAIQEGIGDSNLRSKTVNNILKDSFVKWIVEISECLFFLFFKTQILLAESMALMKLIQDVSKVVVDFSSQHWSAGLLRAQVILQLAQCRALNQCETFLDRDVATAPFTAVHGVGNTLTITKDLKEKIELQCPDGTWPPCYPTQGVSCLAYALLGQQAVDDDCSNKAKMGDVYFFLARSSTWRAFSYIRSNLLPILMVMHKDPNQLLYISVLCDLVYQSLTLFTMPYYHAAPFKGFPFPVTQVDYYDFIFGLDSMQDILILFVCSILLG